MQTLRTATAVFTISPSGEDSFEIIEECEVIDFPVQIDARELQGAELDEAYAEFAFAA